MMTLPENLTLPQLLHTAAERWPDRTVASFPKATLTFTELLQGAIEVAGDLIARGVASGDHVGLLMPNSPSLLTGFFGTSLAGAIPVPMNTRYRADELPYVIEHADLVGIVTLAERTRNNAGEVIDYVARLAEALPALEGQSANHLSLATAPYLRFVLASAVREESWVSSPGAARVHPNAIAERSAAVTREQTSMMLYTSGTTARPKGVLLSHRSVVSTCLRAAVERLGLGPNDVIWNPAPMCHISAFVSLIGALATGAEYATASHFDPEAVCEHLERRGTTIAFANFPAFYCGMEPVMKRRNQALPTLRLVTTAASPPEIERVREIFPHARQISVTGATELSGSICLNLPGDSLTQCAESAGPPIRGVELSIRSPETLSPLPTGEVGEIWVRGICLFDGYHRDSVSPFTGPPEAGWFRTGDLGALDEGGRLTFRGRIKDMLKVGGENVSASEIETFLLRHPAVSVAQVVAAPDHRLGEVPAAFIELKSCATANAEEIIAYCRSGIAAYKVPRLVRFVTEWPTSATKIQKDRLRSMLTAE